MNRERQRKGGILLLAISLVLAHLPLSVALASFVPGVLACSAPTTNLCSEAESGEPSFAAVDACCPPATALILAAGDDCCAPALSGDTADERGDPCCPSGCKHCPKPCCWTPVTMASQDVGPALELLVTPMVELPVPQFTASTLGSIFHPPRG
jgi:hypothetical protein